MFDGGSVSPLLCDCEVNVDALAGDEVLATDMGAFKCAAFDQSFHSDSGYPEECCGFFDGDEAVG